MIATQSRPYRVGGGDLVQPSDELGLRTSRRDLHQEGRNFERPSTRASAASNPTYRQQAGSDSVRRSTESNPRAGRSQADATTGSRSPSLRARDASLRDLAQRQQPQSQDVLLSHVGSHPGVEIPPHAGPPYPTTLSMTGSPPHQPSYGRQQQDNDYLYRQQHDYRAPRSEMYERDGRKESYERHTQRR